MPITYDAIGNPLSYYNGTRYNFTWSDGRRLTSATKLNPLGGTMGSYSFTYNDEGIRTSKTSNGVTHYYTLDGTRIVSEEWGNYFAVYLYDESGAPIGMQIRQSSMADGVFHTYYFEKNLQGDIIGVYNSSGNLVYSYVYDAWGNFTATKHISSDTFAVYNPFRYRGYYYDTDFGFYYLNSRYYDPITGRFINADNVVSCVGGNIKGYNVFAYCFNDPVNMVDPSGNWPNWLECIGDWFVDTWNDVSEVCSIVFTSEFLSNVDDIILSNIEASAGICIGMGASADVGDSVSAEAMFRMDIIGIQFKDGKVRIGSPGKSGCSISFGNYTIGPTTSVYESFDGDVREVVENPRVDYGISGGQAAAYAIGYHYDYSISFSGMFSDVIEYINNRR